jgi:hypothetical protein
MTPMILTRLQAAAGNHAVSSVLAVQRAPKKPHVVIPPSPVRQAMIKQLLEEHPGLHPKVADAAVNAAQRVMGKGGAGGDVVLDPRVTREVSVHAGRLDPQSLIGHLQKEARQTGVREIYLQINTPGATRQSVRDAMRAIQNGVPELNGVRVRVYDSQGRLFWQGQMRFRDTDPVRSRPGGGGTGPGPSSKGPTGGGPGPGAGPARAAGSGPAGGTPPIAGPTTTSTTTASRAAVAKAIAESRTSVARAAALTDRIKVYTKAYGTLTHLLGLLSAIDSMSKLLTHGTALPKEQQQADKVLSDSSRAKEEADQVTEDIDLVRWVTLSGEAERADDDQSLFAIDEAASAIHHSLEHSAAVAQELAEDLEARSAEIKGAMFQRLAGILRPHHSGTESNAVEFALYASLERLHGTVLSGSRNYREAAETLRSWAVQFRGISRWANDAGWVIARRRAIERYRAAHPEAPG